MSTVRKIWKDVIASPEIGKKYPALLEKLRSGEYRGADLDLKVKTPPRVYGIRINEKERLLFTTITIDGIPYAFILEELLDHNYKTCRSMQDGGVEKILKSKEAQKIAADYFEKLKKDNESAPQAPQVKEKKCYELNYLELDYLNDKWLQLNDKQREVLNHSKPMICQGTGKTVIAEAMLIWLYQTRLFVIRRKTMPV